MKRFVHTLSFPEHLWLDFFRSFFEQSTLIIDDDGLPLTNNFKLDLGQPPENRRFDVLLEEDMKANNPNILPSLVLEDLGTQSLNIALNRLADWSVAPETSKTRSDLIRSTYVMHCAAKDRGESRLLASIVSNAVIVFYDQLLESGFHKIEPWSIGKTVPIKSDVLELYMDTPVQITFEYQQTWKTVETGPSNVFRYCLRVRDEDTTSYVRTLMDISNSRFLTYVAMSMNLQDASVNIYVNTDLDISEPLVDNGYVLMSQENVDPDADSGYVRTSMRVA